MLRLILFESSLQSSGQEFGIFFIPLRVIVREVQMSVETVEEIMANQAWFLALFLIFCSSPGILRQPPLLTRERETFWHLLCPCMPYGYFIGEEVEEK